MILYVENPKDATRKLVELINQFSKVVGCKINMQKSFAFLHTNNKFSETENKISRNKSTWGGERSGLRKIWDTGKVTEEDFNMEKYVIFLDWKN